MQLQKMYLQQGHEVNTSKGRVYDAFCSFERIATLADICPRENPEGSRIALFTLFSSFQSWDKPAPCKVSYEQNGFLYHSVMLHPETGILSNKQFLSLSKTDFTSLLTLREWLQRQFFLPESERRAGTPIELSLIVLRVMVINLKEHFGPLDSRFSESFTRKGKGVFTDL
jgi:hypothetical protein